MSQAPDFAHVTFISAGAGSGKTYRLTEELQRALSAGEVDPARVVGMTFTVKAAAELRDRVSQRLLAAGETRLAELTTQALIGTVHSVCERLLKRFSFELGLAPELRVVSQEDGSRLFNQALDETLALPAVRQMNALAARLGQEYWQADVRAVADKIRENNIAVGSLHEMAAASAEALLQHFPVATTPVTQAQLLAGLAQTLSAIDCAADPTKKTAQYVTLLAQAQRQLMQANAPWELWQQLSAATSAKASDSHSAVLRELAGGYAAHADFHADVRVYIEQVMTIAAAGLTRFQALKTQRGLIDFLDMEQLMLQALDDPAVCARLDEEVDLLLVDEFQDTNPMQLALYIKLAQRADRVILVGDVKQAIYAFRGCDPDLVFSTLEGMSQGRAVTAVLEQNWRSRPGLVHFINSVFVSAFAGEISAERVRLEPVRDDNGGTPDVINWRLQGPKSQRALGIAEGISRLHREGYQVCDPDTGQQRPVQWGDIAILARTNKHVELLAQTLADCRIPMKMTLQGLLSVPEVCLARACLRRLNDVSDTLATAEIIAMIDREVDEEIDREVDEEVDREVDKEVDREVDNGADDCETAAGDHPQTWLTDRLQSLAAGQNAYTWAQDTHPLIGRLAELAADASLRSPLEVVARVLHDVGVRRIVSRWGPDSISVAQRHKNLDAFFDLARQYESVCEDQYQAATLTGFLFWLENPASPELDLQPVVTSGDAVHVLTYHRAKGLEWPVVVATDFETKDRTTLWDARILLTGDFDVSAPLANRTLRFWPNLFGRRTRGMTALQAIEGSSEAQACARSSEAENRRLAYVGMTRARDTLVLALAEKDADQAPLPGTWLASFHSDGLFSDSAESQPLVHGGSCRTQLQTLAGEPELPAAPGYLPRWFASRSRQDWPAAVVSPSAAAPTADVHITEVMELGERFAISATDMSAVGNALHALVAAEFVNPAGSDGARLAAALLAAHGVEQQVDPAAAYAAVQRFHTALHTEFAVQQVWVEYPMIYPQDNGAVVRGFIDLLVETEDGMLVIDHKSSPQPRSAWPDLVRQYGGQLQLYATAVEAATGRPVRQFVHFVVSGALVEIKSRDKE
ncbi:MAG: UvrD-helicase domain-containing protein [Pseudomonadota bacterium]